MANGQVWGFCVRYIIINLLIYYLFKIFLNTHYPLNPFLFGQDPTHPFNPLLDFATITTLKTYKNTEKQTSSCSITSLHFLNKQTKVDTHTPNYTIKHYWNSQNYIWKFIFFHFPLHSLNNQTELIHTTLQLAYFKCKPKEIEIRKREKSSGIIIDSMEKEIENLRINLASQELGLSSSWFNITSVWVRKVCKRENRGLGLVWWLKK